MIKLASCYALGEEFELCEEYFKKAEDLGGDCDLYHHRGQVLLTRGDMRGAVEAMEKASQLSPTWGTAKATKTYVQFKVAMTNGDNDNVEKCVKEFEQIVKDFPECPEVLSLQGQLLLETNNLPKAIEQFKKVATLDKTNAGVYVHIAMGHFQMNGDLGECLGILKEGLAIDECNEFVLETMGTLFLQSGDLPSAIEYITKALAHARSFAELQILSSLKRAAEVQLKLKQELGIEVRA